MNAKDKVFVEGPGRVFVFGSNQAGAHGGGAARAAHQMYGAKWGIGEGLTGASYALPTMGSQMRPLALVDLEAAVWRFIEVARSRPALHFFVTRVGCGIAGFTDEQVAPLFRGAPNKRRVAARVVGVSDETSDDVVLSAIILHIILAPFFWALATWLVWNHLTDPTHPLNFAYLLVTGYVVALLKWVFIGVGALVVRR